MREYAVQAGPVNGDPAELTASLNALAANGFELDFLYDRAGEPPLLIYVRDLDPMYEVEP